MRPTPPRVVLCLLLATCSLFGQQSPALPGSASAQATGVAATTEETRALLRAAVQASGGPKAGTLRSSFAIVQVTSYTPEGPVVSRTTIKTSGFDKFRLEPENSANPMIVSNGTVTNIRDGNQRLVVPQLSVGPASVEILPWLAVLQDASDLNCTLIDKGVAVEDSATVHRIQLHRKGTTEGNGLKYEVTLDSQSLLITAVKFERQSTGNKHATVDVEFRFSDSQMTDGVNVPRQISQYVRGQKLVDIQVLSFAVNPAVAAGDFDVVVQHE